MREGERWGVLERREGGVSPFEKQSHSINFFNFVLQVNVPLFFYLCSSLSSRHLHSCWIILSSARQFSVPLSMLPLQSLHLQFCFEFIFFFLRSSLTPPLSYHTYLIPFVFIFFLPVMSRRSSRRSIHSVFLCRTRFAISKFYLACSF